MNEHTRREFIVRTCGTFAAAGGVLSMAGKAHAGWYPLGVERRKLGKTDMEVSALGFGGAEIGFEQTPLETVKTLLNAALDAGLNVIDTAECYAGSEEAIGQAVADRRKEFYLFTKVGHFPTGDTGWSAKGIEECIDRSLKRLKTDRVDLVQLHSCGKDILAKGEVIEALEKAKKAGKTRYIGYSGDTVNALFAIETGRFDTLQTSINIADQEVLDLTLPKARERNMGVIAKRPIANAVWRHDTTPTNNYVVEYWNRLQKLGYDFCKGEARNDSGPNGAAGTALRFTLGQPGVHTAIVGTTKPERWKQNADLLAAGPLPKEKIDAIRARWKEVAAKEWVGQV